MIGWLLLLGIALSVLTALLMALIAIHRHVQAGRKRRDDLLAERLRETALRVIDGEEPPSLTNRQESEALAALVRRYGRHVRSASREHVARYFVSEGHVARAVGRADSRIAWRRAEAALSLGEMRAEGGRSILERLLRDPSPDVRRAAAIGLGQLGSPDSVDAVVHALVARRIPPHVGAAALMDLGAPALPALEHLCRDHDARLRATAIELIGMLGSAASGAQIDRYVHDDRPVVRRAVAVALGRIGDRTGVAALRQMLIDPSPDVRAAAALAVAQLGDLTLLDELTHLALHDDFAVAHAAAEAVLRLEPRRITDLARTTRASAILERADLLKIGAT